VRGNATSGLDGARYVTAPKTASSRRDLTLPVVAIDALARTPRTGDLLWPSPDGGPLRAATFLSAWKAARERAGIPPVTFHALRHTAASLALEEAHPPTTWRGCSGTRPSPPRSACMPTRRTPRREPWRTASTPASAGCHCASWPAPAKGPLKGPDDVGEGRTRFAAWCRERESNTDLVRNRRLN